MVNGHNQDAAEVGREARFLAGAIREFSKGGTGEDFALRNGGRVGSRLGGVGAFGQRDVQHLLFTFPIDGELYFGNGLGFGDEQAQTVEVANEAGRSCLG